MSRDMVFSIDQNCHTLWDPIPKIQALISGGYRVRHFIEDTDVAFTSLGAQNGDVGWHLARERFHHSGGTDWGAALFYSEFLGRLPLEIRDLEPFTGIKTRILAKKLGRTVEQLYEEFSPGQTWQLIGGSYVGDKEHHRLIGDISVADSKDFLCELLEKAYQNMLYTFPEDSSQMRLHEWFKNERKLLKKLLKEHAKGRLIDLYRTWMYSYLPGEVHLDTASSLFTCQLNRQPLEILEIFLSNYELASQLYNQSIQETNLRFRPLLKQEGELPFFAVFKHRGHAVRSPVFLQKGKVIIDNKPFELVEDRGIPLIAMRQAGIQALVGKAIILIIQIRFGNRGNSLALPYRGSLYMPAVEWLIKEMAQNNLLLEKIHPVIRVRLYLLERLKSLNTVIRLPDYLTSYFGKEEISARELGKS
ncbi:MAG TPA: hypothetical protein EYP78_04960, partial [Candidatus Omnitrophica bacterium]|nr:hypothetical protein [Candidatus Omnitrophota bacterium]